VLEERVLGEGVVIDVRMFGIFSSQKLGRVG
jgi:hypothetical protein